MKILLKYIIISFLLITFCSIKAFSARVKYDSAKVEVKLPSEEKLKEFRSKNDFNYKREFVPSESIFDRIMEWIGKAINSLFSNRGLAPLIRWLIISGLILFIVLRLMNVKAQRLFFRNQKQNSLFMEAGEMELLKSDLDELINKEILNKNYRLAVRYLYLKLLKILNDKEIIMMQVNKTNDDYKDEMFKTKYNAEFLNLSRVFEFVFYGNFSVEKNVFDKVNTDFNSIFNKLNE